MKRRSDSKVGLYLYNSNEYLEAQFAALTYYLWNARPRFQRST